MNTTPLLSWACVNDAPNFANNDVLLKIKSSILSQRMQEMHLQDIVFILDLSESMNNHIDILKDAMSYLLKERLKPISAYVTIIAFGTYARIVWEGRLDDSALSEAVSAVNTMKSMGMTNMSTGLSLAASSVPKQGSERKIFIFSDGQINRGEMDPEKLVRFTNRPLKPGNLHSTEDATTFETHMFLFTENVDLSLAHRCVTSEIKQG
jgi:Mg-chelatase subunit ChlD